jgi:hypothetical protein
MVEQSAEGIALVVTEHRVAVKRLAHLLDEHRREHAFELLAGGLG